MAGQPLRIGVSARLMHVSPPELGFRGKALQYLEQSVAHWIMAHGALAFMVPTIGSGDPVGRRNLSVRDCVSALDGLVLQGGADISPESYGETPERPEWTGDRVRDLYEIELLWEFAFQGKPVLGICRGCQLINVAMGGSLWQDIPTHIPGAIAHRDDALYDAHHHAVVFAPESRLAALYTERESYVVNSIHHQAVNRLGNDLVVEAWSPDDRVIEAIRGRGSSYLAGFQWHPEFHGRTLGLLDSGPLLEEFLIAAQRAAARGGDRRARRR